MKNAIIAIRNLETNEVQEFTSKDAAAKAMQAFGVSRTKGRELATQTVESGTVHNCEGFTLAQPAYFAGDALAPAKADEAPAKVANPRHVASHNPPRLVAALFARAGFGFARA